MRNSFSYYFHRSKKVAEEEGLISLIKKGFHKIRVSAYETNDAMWFGRSLDQPLPKINIPKIAVVIASESEFEKWLQQQQTVFSWVYVEQEVLATLNDPKIPFVAKVNNKIVGYLKVAIRNAYVLDYDAHIELPRDVAFVQDTFVLPEFRGRGIAKSVISKAMIYLKNQGYSRMFCHIPQWNIASIRTFTSLGFKPYGNIRFLRIFKWKVYTRKPERLIKEV